MNVINDSILIEDSHFEYLRLQKGKLDSIAKHRDLWERTYRLDLLRTYEEIRPFLPEHCWGLLDIGSGLGGIDVLLYRHYVYPRVMVSNHGPFINLLDGEADAPVMELHRQTFNDMKVARDFQQKNGVPSDRFFYYTPDSTEFVKPFDLVVSFGSWCFHYEPNVYLDKLFSGGGLHKNTVLIVDVRREKPDWEKQLWRRMSQVTILRESEKFRRIVYVVE